MPTIWIARLLVSARTAQKLVARHRLDAEQVRLAVECVAGLEYAWEDEPLRGRRAILKVTIDDQRVLVVLYPADDPLGDVWNLGSAYRL